MEKSRNILKRACALLTAAIIISALFPFSAQETPAAELSAGEYEISGELSAYLSAMGGVEFGGPLMTGVYLVVDEDGSEYLKLTFTKSSVTIYSITCDTFVDASPSTVTTTRGVEDGTIGIYDASGNLVTEGVTYTLSNDTALNAADEEVNYVDSATFPISSREDSYNLAVYINSNVMGVEFCNENSAATETTYEATLTVDWSAVEALEADAETEETETAAEETTEETTIEADEDLDGLSIYEADEAGDETGDETAAAESAASASSLNIVLIAVIAAVIVIIIVVIIIVIANRKKKVNKNE